MTSGWLPKEMLDHLHHAGYVAVPKECIEQFQVEERSTALEAAYLNSPDRGSYNISRLRDVGATLGRGMVEKGFVDVKLDIPDPRTETLITRASVHVLKPRTIRQNDG